MSHTQQQYYKTSKLSLKNLLLTHELNFFSVLTVNYWKIMGIFKQKSYNKYEQDHKTNKTEKLLINCNIRPYSW